MGLTRKAANLILLGTLVTLPICYGGQFTYGDLTLETMMEAQLWEQILVQTVVPWRVTDAVTYNYDYNTSTGAFDFATVPNQSVAGLPFSFSASAQLDAVNGIWSWSGTGVIGALSFQITGDATATLDPKEDIKGKYIDDNGTEHDATASVDITTDDHGNKLSNDSGQATDKDGNVIKKGKVHDFISNGGWAIDFVVETPPSPPNPEGAFDTGLDIPFLGPPDFKGSFVQTSVPEPSTLSGLLSGGVGLICFRMLLRRRKSLSLGDSRPLTNS